MFGFGKKKKQESTENSVKPVFLKTASNSCEFSMIKGALEHNKIPYITQDHGGESFLRIKTGAQLGITDFLVSELDYSKAKDIIDNIVANDEKLENMDDFFASRIDMYENHMLTQVEDLKEAYEKMAEILPLETKELLDLGCGTGLELDEIFKTDPNVAVTGIDLTQTMLDKLAEKHPDKNLNLICGNYFDVPFGKEKFDAAISFETLHHFTHEEKIELYRKIFEALKLGGCYIECDYMVAEQKEEDFYVSELKRLKRLQNISDDQFVHYDTPCIVENQIKMLETAGFSSIEKIWQKGGTVILKAEKI